MLIGELAAKTGLTRDTIRFYEKQGLIAVGRKERRFNNYKEYTDQTHERLLTIKRIKGFGFTLNETREFLEMISANAASCETVSVKIAEKVSVIDAKIKELELIKKLVLNGLNNCQNCCSPETEVCPLLWQQWH
jgi:DNA-binding transcriptional MerR regulator